MVNFLFKFGESVAAEVGRLLILALFLSAGLLAKPVNECIVAFGKLTASVSFSQVQNNRVISALSLNPRLEAEADFATRDARVQREMNSLLQQEIGGSGHPGFGRFTLGNGYFELRGAHGARLFIRRLRNSQGGDDIIVVGKATKKGSGNENTVFHLMQATFPDFPKSFGRYQSRQ